MEKICKHCNEKIVVEKIQQFAYHVSRCLKNPNIEETMKKTYSNINKVPRIILTLNCKKCDKQYTVELTESELRKGRYKIYCSRSCANSHVVTKEHKRKLKRTLIKNGYVPKFKRCKLCKKLFEVLLKKDKLYCSNKCMTSDPELNKLRSDNKKIYFKEHPEKHPNRLCAGIKESYPERMLREYFELKGLNKETDFKQQYKIEKYFIDFFIPKLNLGIEVDGERWHRDKEKEIKREKILNNYIDIIRFDSKKLVKKQYQTYIDEIINKMRM